TPPHILFLFFLTDPPPPDLSTLSLHDALPISAHAAEHAPRRSPGGEPHGARDPVEGHERARRVRDDGAAVRDQPGERDLRALRRSEEHTSELQSLTNLVCRLLLEKKKNTNSESANTAKRTSIRKKYITTMKKIRNEQNISTSRL